VERAKEYVAANRPPQKVPVPTLLSSPIGWLQAKLINAGRQNEDVKNVLVDAAHYSNNATTGAQAIVSGTNTIVQETIVEPALVGLANGWNNAVTGAQNLLNLGAYGLNRASQGAQTIVSAVKEKIYAPIKDGLLAWAGVFKNGKEILRTLPGYINETHVQPIIQVIREIRNDLTVHPKKIIADAITTGAEYLHIKYNNLSSFVGQHPKILEYSNAVIDPLRNMIGQRTNMNLNTMDWNDLGKIWLFELGGEDYKGNPPIVTFGPNALTTKDVMDEEAVQEARTLAIEKIKDGDLSPLDPEKCNHTICWHWKYNQKEFYNGISQRNTATSFLGSYSTFIDVTPNPDGSFTLNYTVQNPSGWASGTRLRKAAPGSNEHRPIIPDKERGVGLHLGGNLVERWQWSETINLGDE